LREIEKRTKKQLLDPAVKEYSAYTLNQMAEPESGNAIAAALKPGGLANFLRGTGKVGRGMERTGEAVASPGIRGILQAGASRFGRREPRP